MAVAALQGTFTNPDDPDDAVLTNAYFVVVAVTLDRRLTVDGLATYEVHKSLARKNAGARPRYTNTAPFNYVHGGGSAYAQATAAVKALAQFPGLIDV